MPQTLQHRANTNYQGLANRLGFISAQMLLLTFYSSFRTLSSCVWDTEQRNSNLTYISSL